MISCCFFNARSLKNKIVELHALLYKQNATDILCVCESWLTNSVSNAMLDPQSLYNIYRHDRKGKCGGGVVVFVTRELPSFHVEFPDDFQNIEFVCFDIIGICNVRVLTLYRPGKHVDGDHKVMLEICSCIKTNCGINFSTVIFADMNCRSIDWINNISSNFTECMFIECISEQGFQQFIDTPTRGDNILDILLCNDHLLISDVEVVEPFSTSDHASILCLLNTCENFDVKNEVINLNKHDETIYNGINNNNYVNDINCELKKCNWYKADWKRLENFFSYSDWDVCFPSGLSSDAYWNNFYSIISFAVSNFVKKKEPNALSRKNSRKKVIKYPKIITKLQQKKIKLWRKFKANRNKNNKSNYDAIAKCCKDQMQSASRKSEENILASGDLGIFYKYVNSKLCCKTGIAPLTSVEGNLVFDDERKANLLNNYFAEVCVTDNNKIPNFTSTVPEDTLSVVNHRESEILKHLLKQKLKMSSGPDNLPPIFYKKLSHSICRPLTRMFNLFSNNGCIPTIWKQATVVPIFKKGKSSAVENYRPISLTCVACKIFESTLSKALTSFFKMNNVLNVAQHGFLEGHSTCTNIIESLNDWTVNVNNKHYTRVAYIDFARAFDTVCHSKLLFKLRAVGIEGSLLDTIESFLTDRFQKVIVNGKLSDSASMISGVPQGSVLGPLLFLVYINDLANIFPTNITSKFFADDAKIYTEVVTSADIDNLQFSLDEVSAWAERWQLSFSINKCCTIDLKLSKFNDVFCNNTLEGIELECVQTIKDLGVIVDNSLKFHNHIQQLVADAKKRSYLIYRCFESKNLKSLLLGYKSYILPILNYASPVWSPSTVYEINLIERVQRSYTKKIPVCLKMSYPERLKYLNIPSLELRRLRNDLIFCYKILNNFVSGPPEKYGLSVSTRSSRGHHFKLLKQQSNYDIRKFFFSNRVCNPWNSLPENVVNSNSVLSFKNELRKCNLDHFLVCFV